MDIISVVFGADTKKDRTKDTIKIVEYAFANYKMVDMAYMLHSEFDGIVESTRFNVEKGISNNVILELEENNVGFYPVRSDLVKDISVKSNIQENLSAPVEKYDKLGEIEIMIGEGTIYKVDILAGNSVQKKGIWDYMKEMCKKLRIDMLY